ncbi:restriction endonuclease subunit S [Mycoplasma sp. 4044]
MFEKEINKLMSSCTLKKELLENICVFGNKGNIAKKDLNKNGKYNVVNSSIDYFGKIDKFNNSGEWISITSHGENAGHVKYLNENFYAGKLCYILKSKDENLILTKFLYYYLKNNENVKVRTNVIKSSIKYMNFQSLIKIEIAIPVVEVQKKIVEILDTFQSSTAELTAELNKRLKQYDYYRDLLLSNDNGVFSVANQYNLDEICDFKKGNVVRLSSLKMGNIPIVSGGKEVSGYTDKSNFDGETIAVAASGSAGYVSWWNEPIFVSDAFTLKNKNNDVLNLKYLFYWLKSKQDIIYSFKKGVGTPHVYISDVSQMVITLPHIDKQNEIVRWLDNFYTICKDLNIGLPAELEARNKQYELYRDKLFEYIETGNINVDNLRERERGSN